MADLEVTRKADLEDIMDAVLHVAQLVLRDKDVRDELKKIPRGDRTAYWRVFFQVVLSNPFGEVMPGDLEHEVFRKQLLEVRDRKLQDGNKLLKDRISKYAEWSGGKHTLYAVAQFWNADDARVPAFVVSEELADKKVDARESQAQGRVTEQAQAATSETWEEYWQLMNEITNQEAEREADEPKLAPGSLGNLIVKS